MEASRNEVNGGWVRSGMGGSEAFLIELSVVLFVIKNFGLNLSKFGLISVKIRSNMKCLTGQLS
jgi:hypothetical protein